MHKFDTRCVHSGTIHDVQEQGINSPIYPSTSFAYIDRPDTVYPRYMNTPNEKAVAEKVAALEEGEAGLIFSSGMAAISTVLFAFLRHGDHAVFQQGLYGGTSHFLDREMKKFGLDYTVARGRNAGDLAAAIRPNTRLIYIETPSNPLLNITDLDAVAAMAREAGIPTVIDNTFASPVNQQPIKHGIDVVVHSATKYMGGHSDILAGAVVTRKNLWKEVYETGLNLGGSMNAFTLYLLERSLKTIHLRVERCNRNAMEIAAFLESHPGVKRVNYPGLPTHPGHEVASRQMKGFGGMLSFEPAGKSGIEVQKRFRLIRPSMSLGGLETISSSPALTSHRHLGPEGRAAEGIPEELIRLSVGIEDPEDLMEDLDQALG